MISADVELTNILHSLESLVPIIDNYHPPLDFIVLFNSALVNEHFESPLAYNFKNCNFDDISHFLRSIDFDLNLNNNLSFESLIDKFYEIIYHSFSLFVLKTKIYNKYSLIWANAELRDCIIKKKCAHKKYKLFPSDSNYYDFSNLRKKFKHLITICHDQYISNIENSIQTNIKPFWNFFNSLKKSNNSVPDCVNYNNSCSTNISETAHLFANYFSSVYTKDIPLFNGVVPLPSDVSNNYLNLCSWTIDLNEIVDYLNSLNTHSGTGPDGIPPMFLKACSSVLARPLHMIFNMSLGLGYFPNIWKKSFITPVHKSGDKHNVTNYRPISKLFIIPKMVEALITKKLSLIMVFLISHNQHGFRPKMSISTNILLFQEKMLLALNQRVQLNTIYTDFQKAFDKVNNNILLYKLSCFGIHGTFFNWLKSYLCSRTQVVKINSYVSNDFLVSSGVPQGSYLGPLLFILFINDLPSIFVNSVNILLFADDAKLFLIIKSPNDALQLQLNLDKFVEWSRVNHLPLNINKCSVITFSRINNIITYNYLIDSFIVTRVSSIKDLGISLILIWIFLSILTPLLKKLLRCLVLLTEAR